MRVEADAAPRAAEAEDVVQPDLRRGRVSSALDRRGGRPLRLAQGESVTKR